MTELRSDLEEAINRTAYRLYLRYRNYVDAGDIRQEMWTWVASKPVARINELLMPRLRQRLYDAGDIYCRREKATKAGYSPDDEVFYSMRILRELWQAALDDELLASEVVDDTNNKVARRTAAGAGMNIETTMADIRRGLQQLPAHHRQALEAHNEFGMAEAVDVTKALRALQRRLGGRRPMTGGI